MCLVPHICAAKMCWGTPMDWLRWRGGSIWWASVYGRNFPKALHTERLDGSHLVTGQPPMCDHSPFQALRRAYSRYMRISLLSVWCWKKNAFKCRDLPAACSPLWCLMWITKHNKPTTLFCTVKWQYLSTFSCNQQQLVLKVNLATFWLPQS